jgi:hypothetical protein
MLMKLRLAEHLKVARMRNKAQQLIKLITKPLRLLKFKLQSKLNLIDLDTIYFEGGLGSQILSYILFRYKIEKNEKVLCDLTYFNNIIADSHEEKKVSLWSYKLDHYGIPITNLPNRNRKSRLKLKPKFIPLDFLSVNHNFLSKVKSEIKVNFENLNTYLKTHGLKADDSYGVIHLRKGDYLFVASHLITEKQVIELISKISEFLTEKIFVASDGEIDESLFAWLKINKPTIQLFQTEKEIDPYILHDLMRNSRLLIAANSTFSFSAALLSSEKTIAFIPQIFYKEDLVRSKDSPTHQFASNYAILKY